MSKRELRYFFRLAVCGKVYKLYGSTYILNQHYLNLTILTKHTWSKSNECPNQVPCPTGSLHMVISCQISFIESYQISLNILVGQLGLSSAKLIGSWLQNLTIITKRIIAIIIVSFVNVIIIVSFVNVND